MEKLIPWVHLGLAGILEVLWASGFRQIHPSKPLLSLGVVAAMIGSFAFLWMAVQKLPVGTAYAVWTGIGAVGAVLVGILYNGEPATVARIVCVLFIVAGIVGLKLFS